MARFSILFLLVAAAGPWTVLAKGGDGSTCVNDGDSCKHDPCCAGLTCVGSGNSAACAVPPPPTPAPVTAAPVTAAPVTAAPVTAAPVTAAPITSAPVPTNAPVTSAPVTSAPATDAPVTSAPITLAPVTSSPVTSAPITSAPVTDAPITAAPVTPAPVAPTNAPVTSAPVTSAPVTSAPITPAPVNAPAPAPVYTLGTPSSSTQYNNINGYFFDVEASGPSGAEVKSITVKTVNAGTLQLFTRSGSGSGSTSSSTGWTPLGSYSVPGASNVKISFSSPLIVPSGTERAFYAYSSGSIYGYYPGPQGPAFDAYVSDSEITITHAYAVPYLWSTSYYDDYNPSGLSVEYSQYNPPPTQAPVPTTPAPIPPTPAPVPAPPLCPPPDSSKYNMCIDAQSTGTYANGDWTLDLAAAKTKWESIITGDLPSWNPPSETYADAICDNYPTSPIDDLYICTKDANIDGAGKILGSAGPRYIYSYNGKVLPYTGFMRFDIADIDSMLGGGTWTGVVLHEIGHILGIGTLWDHNNLVTGTSYNGAQGCYWWQQITGCTDCPPIETEGGDGTAGGHWNEEGADGMALDHELMTGYVESAGVTMPISKITVGSLEDMGYTVNINAADVYNNPPTCTRRERGLRGDVRYMDTNGRVLAQDGDMMKEPTVERKKISDAGRNTATNYGNNELKKAKAQKANMSEEEAAGFVGDQAIDIIIEEEGTIYFVGVTGDGQCIVNGSECTHSDECCSEICHGNGKCVGRVGV